MQKPTQVIVMGNLWYLADAQGYPLRSFGCFIEYENAFKALQNHQRAKSSNPVGKEVTQTRMESFIEQCLSTATGFLVSLLLWTMVVVPIWNLPMSMDQNLIITGLFTVASIARGYFWRRFFANSVHKQIHKWLKKQ